MKICPQCNAQYEDSMFFCLEDGTPLKSNDSAVQSNPATFENTLILPTNDKTLNLPPQNEIVGEKTLPIIPETQTEQKSVKTNLWQPETIQQQKPSTAKTDENVMLASYTESNKSNGRFILIAALFGGIALLGTAFGGWWFLQKNSDEVAIANTNKQSNTSNNSNSLGLSNSNISNAFGETNSAGSNLQINSNVNTNKATPKPSPSATKEKDETPTPTPTATPQPTSTPIPKTPTPTPTPAPTPAPTRQTPKIISGGVLNGKATNLVRPSYPPAARAVRASGAVSVQVLIDEDGNVARAAAVSGHALLRAAAEQAARSSKFSPTLVGGQPVKVTGVIVYNFSAQ